MNIQVDVVPSLNKQQQTTHAAFHLDIFHLPWRSLHGSIQGYSSLLFMYMAYSQFDGHLLCFKSFTITKSAVINQLVFYQYILEQFPRSGIARSKCKYTYLYEILLDIANSSPQGLQYCAFPSAVYQNACLPMASLMAYTIKFSYCI